MKTGWYQENGKTYYLNSNILDSNYGKMLTGAQNIDGQVYIFDSNGVLVA
jgi:glucan-binding YG repeat protein